MFIRDLDDVDNKNAKENAILGLPFKSIFSEQVQIGERSINGNQLKWSVFHDFPAGKMYEIMQDWVFPFIKNLHADKNSAYSKYMDDAIFKLPTPLVLSKVIDSLDDICLLYTSKPGRENARGAVRFNDGGIFPRSGRSGRPVVYRQYLPFHPGGFGSFRTAGPDAVSGRLSADAGDGNGSAAGTHHLD